MPMSGVPNRLSRHGEAARLSFVVTHKENAMIKVWILILSAFLLSGCATAYQPKGFTGGFSETQLDESVFQVSFRGNAYTSSERAADFTLLRSAELTIENGYR